MLCYTATEEMYFVACTVLHNSCMNVFFSVYSDTQQLYECNVKRVLCYTAAELMYCLPSTVLHSSCMNVVFNVYCATQQLNECNF